jgi:hypothetical protein
MRDGTIRDPGTPPGATIAARAVLALYPPSWRARYGDEVHALLDESGGGARAIASVAWRRARRAGRPVSRDGRDDVALIRL